MNPHRIAEPCEVWRSGLQDGRVAHAMVVPRGYCCSFLWLINDVLEGGEDCADWESAVIRAGQVRQGLMGRRQSR